MIKKETDCLGCGLPCLGYTCPHYKMIYAECDLCGNDDAKYELNDEHLCDDCVKLVLRDEWNKNSDIEKADILLKHNQLRECVDNWFDDSDIEEQAKYTGVVLEEIDFRDYDEDR